VFVDSVEQSSHSGEVNVPWSQGLMNKEKLAGTIGDVIAGRIPGRTGDKEITVFDSTGLSIQDMAVAHLVYERSLKEHIGLDVNI
jgi:alanine dehydrogenase